MPQNGDYVERCVCIDRDACVYLCVCVLLAGRQGSGTGTEFEIPGRISTPKQQNMTTAISV